MKSMISAALVVASFGIASAQSSLQVASMDSVVRGNSYASGQLTGHINLRNTSSSSKDYYARRAKVGSSAVVDSNYFCWDLCYPTWSSNSMGTVTIPAGGVANDFSCYIYLKAAGLTGVDTIWYTFKNAADANDTLRVGVAWELSTTFSLDEAIRSAAVWVDANGLLRAESAAWMVDVNEVFVFDVLGREIARFSGVQALLNGVDLPGSGWHTVRFASSSAVLRTEKVFLR
jgi:hypothetical protein